MTNQRLSVDDDLWWRTDAHCHHLFDADGNAVGILPKAFTEAQVRAAARLANAWYAAGMLVGEQETQSRMRDALGLGFGEKPANT